MQRQSTKPPVQLYPVYIKHVNREDYWKIESPTKGHFIRNLQTPEGGYCYQSNDVKETEVSIVLRSDSSEVIDEKRFIAALESQATRNDRILKKLSKK